MSRFNNNDPTRFATINAAHFALKSTCQLYQWSNEELDRFVANGCVILFEYNSSFYCFSNAHVLADHQLGKTFFLLKDGTTMTVGGELYYSEHPSSEKRADDSLDIAIVKFNPNVVKHLIENGHVFLTHDQILTGIGLEKGNIVLVAGYPASKTKIDFKINKLKFNPLILRTIPYLRNVDNENFTKGFHHIIEYPIKSFRETSTKERMRGPQPFGISGSGLWLFNEADLNSTPALIGILSEYHENQAILIGTKIDLFIELLKQLFDPSIQNNGLKVELGDV